MSNHTQRDELKQRTKDLLEQARMYPGIRMSTLVTKSMREIDQYTQRLVLEGKLADAKDGWHHQKHIEATGVSAWFADHMEDYQSQLDKLNGDRES